jgi:hypothetical protein
MKFKLDENLPSEIIDDLVGAGHEADTVIDEGYVGAADIHLVDVCRAEERILLTMDKGIANIRAFPKHTHAGIVLFRPATQGRGATLAFVRRHLPALLASELKLRLIVVTEAGIRIR